MDDHTKNHAKYLIVSPIIFVGTYRKLVLDQLGEAVKAIYLTIIASSQFSSEEREVDRDHIHCLVKSEPRLSFVVQLVMPVKT